MLNALVGAMPAGAFLCLRGTVQLCSMEHWHIWLPWVGRGKATNAYMRRVKCYYTRSAANKAKLAPANMGNSSLPALVLKCVDPHCKAAL